MYTAGTLPITTLHIHCQAIQEFQYALIAFMCSCSVHCKYTVDRYTKGTLMITTLSSIKKVRSQKSGIRSLWPNSGFLRPDLKKGCPDWCVVYAPLTFPQNTPMLPAGSNITKFPGVRDTLKHCRKPDFYKGFRLDKQTDGQCYQIYYLPALSKLCSW